MDYNKFQKDLEKEGHGDGITVGAFFTGEFTLYLLFIFGALIIGRVYGKTLMTLFGLSALAFSLSTFPIIFQFKKENSNAINYQLFWLSVFLGAIAFCVYLTARW
ncbi:MAG: hypothetical protein GXN95_05590 [Methanococci archaeon]|uniref:Uncharacterized protein n=1 Tax=Methanocaldococcus vulcanius (strain ATCC 700851 / DSM 12094 / M7) TaxID=579137 RepID=C9RE27_METVM|nr:hypothetical protein [Methanocaldococcus vulcanius]ACX73556.1 conserved hypothetical protein [Methanocaldococcus vulcanius M7]NPA63006.1 hypothetical protein [Methanococci archaeon]